jgi:hypothetical protein
MKNFPASMEKILLVASAVVTLAGCQSTSVSANADSRQLSSQVSSQVPVVAPAGSVLRVRLDQALDTKRSRPGDRFSGVLDSPLSVDGNNILPKGTIVEGHVLNVHSSGRLKGRAALVLTLDSCQRDGRTLALSAGTAARVSGRHRKRNWALIGGGSGTGALVGGVVAGPVGAVVGAGSGAVAGTVGAAISGKKEVSIPAESVVGFTLKNALVV